MPFIADFTLYQVRLHGTMILAQGNRESMSRENTMVYRGHVEKGVVVLDEPVVLPEGLAVNIEPSLAGQQEPALDNAGETLGQKLLKHAGKATGLPHDLAENHDHYLYGTPKK
jgi:hypothetical protein